jgi:hypothetical protein
MGGEEAKKKQARRKGTKRNEINYFTNGSKFKRLIKKRKE